jgi:PAS domain S-box-containing protein
MKIDFITRTVFFLTLPLAVLSGCGKFSKEPAELTVDNLIYRDIPELTNEEIIAIQNIIKKYGSFTCAINLNTDSFYDKNGELSGYAISLYDWLSGLFGIHFTPEFYEWGNMLKKIENGEIDFTIELAETPERMASYYMTKPIAQRPIKLYRISDAEPLESIIETRKPRYAFLTNSVMITDTAANAGYDFETVIVENHADAYLLLKDGRIDAYIALDNAEAVFDVYGDVTSENFFPLIFRSFPLLTGKAELKPVIDVLDKILNPGTLAYLNNLRMTEYQKYLKNKLFMMLTGEEHAYIEEHPVIPIAAEFNNYPVSFFDTQTKQWQGIYFDALKEVEKMTGIRFECVNKPDLQYSGLIAMLENGEARIMSELFRIKDYEGRFLWSDIPLIRDNYAFITKSDFRNIDISEVSYLRIGIRKNTHYSELFKKMFPGHRNFTEYDTQEETWKKLESGEVDAIFSSRRRLVIYTNYHEEAGFKLNLQFDNYFNTSFGFNRDSAVLRSVVDKVCGLIMINKISNQWMNRNYDYRAKINAARLPWLTGASILFFLSLLLALGFWTKSRSAGKQLEDLVKERTKKLAFETSKLRAVIDSIPDILFCKDNDYKYTQCNSTFEKFMGITEAEVIGRSDEDGAWFHAEDIKRIHDMEKDVVLEEEIHISEEKLNSPITGKESIFETIKAPIKQDGAVVGLVAIVRDITRRKTMENEIRIALESKTSFLAHMSHELRTPLNVVIGLTNLILEEARLDFSTTNNILKINNAGSTLLSIVNDILDFSKIESGKIELAPVEYHTASLLNDVITVAITRIGEKPVKFYLDIEEDMPEKLFGDDLRVKQIFINLLNNAVKFTHEGSIVLIVRCVRENSNTWLDIAVRDTGIGIREENLKRLFSDYYQVNEKANRGIEGTGLGLQITKRLIELMSGRITAESEYGKGTTFRLRIRQGFVNNTPLGAVTADKLRSYQYSEDKRIADKRISRLDLSYARVLVVDDVLTNLDVAAGLLRKYKMQVDCLDNGPAAVERIKNGTPVYNAVFMDHMMPDMDGIEAAEAIRALDTEYARKIPIIALTANAIHGTEQMFLEHNFQAFISKPIDMMEMDLVIKKWVRDDRCEEVPILIEPVYGGSSVQITIEIPGVDTKEGLSLYNGDTGVYLTLLRSYAANTPGLLQKLRNVSQKTLPKYNVSVHGLKSSSASIGAESIREAALELETLSNEGNLQGVWALNGKLIADTKIIVGNIKKWLEQYDANKEKKPLLKAPDRELLKQLRLSCEKYDIKGADKILAVLENADYEEGGDIIKWVRERIENSDFSEAAQELKKYGGKEK